MTIPAVFKPFLSQALDAFSFLVSEYGFTLMTQSAVGPEAWVVYETPTTRVTAHYELGAEPWIEIGRLELRDSKIVQPASVGLELVARVRGAAPEKHMHTARDLSGDELHVIMRSRAETLRSYADDLLSGDFHRFPELERKAEEEIRDRDRELFGG